MIGSGEIVIIFLLILVVLGPKHIPQAAKFLADLMRYIRQAREELRHNLHLDEFDNVRRDFRDTWRTHRPNLDLTPKTGADKTKSETSNAEHEDLSQEPNLKESPDYTKIDNSASPDDTENSITPEDKTKDVDPNNEEQ